jgi:hypothetical protein
VAQIAALFLLLMLVMIFDAAQMKPVFDVPFTATSSLCSAGIGVHPLRHRTGHSDCDVFRSRHSRHSSADILSIPCSLQLRARSRRGSGSALLQPRVRINPSRHFSVIARSNIIKGTGFAGLWADFLILGVFTLILAVLSVWRFREMLS